MFCKLTRLIMSMCLKLYNCIYTFHNSSWSIAVVPWTPLAFTNTFPNSFPTFQLSNPMNSPISPAFLLRFFRTFATHLQLQMNLLQIWSSTDFRLSSCETKMSPSSTDSLFICLETTSASQNDPRLLGTHTNDDSQHISFTNLDTRPSPYYTSNWAYCWLSFFKHCNKAK